MSILKSFFLLLFIFYSDCIFSSENDNFSLGASYKVGNLLPQRKILNNLNQEPFKIYQVQYFFNPDTNKLWREIQPNVTFGLQFGLIPFPSDSVGNAYTFHLKGLIGIYKYKRWESTLDLGIGFSWVDKVFDQETNFQNLAVSTNLNIYAEVEFHNRFIINKHLSAVLRGGLGHISNSGTTKPNSGLNFLSIGTGIIYSFNDYNPITFTKNKKIPLQKQWWITAFGTVNEYITLNPVIGISNTLELKTHQKTSWLVGIDLLSDGSKIKFAQDVNKDNRINYLAYTSLGISYGAKFYFSKFHFLLQNGFYAVNSNIQESRLYNRIGFGYQLSPKYMVYFNSKTHQFNAEHFELSIAYGIF